MATDSRKLFLDRPAYTENILQFRPVFTDKQNVKFEFTISAKLKKRLSQPNQHNCIFNLNENFGYLWTNMTNIADRFLTAA